MSPTAPSVGRRVLLATALLLPAAFAGACSVVGEDGCHGTSAELRRLAEQPLLASAPTGASAPANYRGVGVTTGCDDDSSGPPWLHADRLYAFSGGPDDVLAHYTKTAAAAGWLVRRTAARVSETCWTRTEQGRHLLLDVDLRPTGFSPEPETGTGFAYSVSIGTGRDGGEESC